MDSAMDADEEIEVGGLLGGLTAWHLRMLCESGWNGGAGYTPEQVGRMTLDQIWFRLCDEKVLKRRVGGRMETMAAPVAVGVVGAAEDGTVAGRDRDGNPIRGRIGGKSLARRLMEEEAEKRKKSEKKNRKRKRRKR